MEVEPSMQYCRTFFKDSFETHKTFPRSIITEFEYIVDVQNHEFHHHHEFQNSFFKLLNNAGKNVNKILQ